MKRFLVALVAMAACSGDDGGSSITSCEVTFSGDYTDTAACKVFLCYPTTNDYEALLISAAEEDDRFQFAPAITKPGAFAVGTKTISDFDHSTTDFYVSVSGKEYRARATSDRTADESAMLTITKLTPPSAEPCDGSITGTMTVSLVELSNNTGTPVVGTGRVQASIKVGD